MNGFWNVTHILKSLIDWSSINQCGTVGSLAASSERCGVISWAIINNGIWSATKKKIMNSMHWIILSSNRGHVTMTSFNGNNFCITGLLWWESTCHRWIPLTKASDAELWFFLRSPCQQTVEQNHDHTGDLRCHRIHCNDSLGRHLIGIGISIINLRLSSDCLTFIMGFPTPMRQRHFSE